VDLSIPRDLETVVHKALERDPGHRYQSAGELADDLKRYLGDEPIRARRTSPIARFGRWCRRNPALASLSSAVAMLLMVTSVVSIVAYQQTSAALVQAKEKANEARQNAVLAEKKTMEAQTNAAEAAENALRAERNELQAQQNARDAQKHAQRAEETALLAQKNEQEAKENAQREKAQREAVQRQLYVSQMNVAGRAWEDHNAGRTSSYGSPGTGTDQWYRSPWLEWHHLWRLCHSECESTAAICLAFTRMKQFVTGTWHGPLKMWSADGAREIWNIPDVGGQLDFIQPRWKTLATSHPQVVKLRDRSRQELRLGLGVLRHGSQSRRNSPCYCDRRDSHLVNGGREGVDKTRCAERSYRRSQIYL
jgi:hypothetical protein